MDIIDKKVVESIIMLVFHVLFSHRYQCAKQSVDFAGNAVQDPGANFRRAALFLETAVASSDLNWTLFCLVFYELQTHQSTGSLSLISVRQKQQCFFFLDENALVK